MGRFFIPDSSVYFKRGPNVGDAAGENGLGALQAAMTTVATQFPTALCPAIVLSEFRLYNNINKHHENVY